MPNKSELPEPQIYNRVRRINLGTLEQVMDEVTTHVMSPITRADGRQGFMIIKAKGQVTSRRKQVISMEPIFPSDEEQARLDAGETVDDIIASYLQND